MLSSASLLSPFHRPAGLGPLGAVLIAIISEFGREFGSSADVQLELAEGDECISSGNYLAAVRHYSNAIELDAESPLLYNKRATAYLMLRQQGHAIRDLDRAIELDREFLQGYLQRGRAQAEICRFEGGEKDFHTILKMKPGHQVATRELSKISEAKKALKDAETLHSKGRIDEARSALNEVFKSAKDCVTARLLEALMFFGEEEYEQVVAQTGRLLKSEQSNIEALTLRGKAYVRLNEFDVAKRHFGEAVRHDPDTADAKAAFSEVKAFQRKLRALDEAVDSRKWSKAEGLCLEGLGIMPHHVDTWWKLCEVRYNKQNYTGAAEACDRVLKLDEEHEQAVALRIHALIGAEEFDRAVGEAKEAMQKFGESERVLEALQSAEKALKMSKRKNYYKILGVSNDASEQEIKKAYRDGARMYHPDKATGDKEEAEEKFREVAMAYEVLSDPEKRRRFDAGEDLEDIQQSGGTSTFFTQGGFGGQRFFFHFG